MQECPEIENALVNVLEAMIEKEKEKIERQEDAIEHLRKRHRVGIKVHIANDWEDHGGQSVTVTSEGSMREALKCAMYEYRRQNGYKDYSTGKVPEKITVSAFIYNVAAIELKEGYYLKLFQELNK